MCNRESLLAKRWRKVTFHPSFWGHDRNHYFSGVLFTKYHTMSMCSLSFQRSSWTEIQLDQIWWPFWRTKSLHFRTFITHPSVHRLCDLVSFLYGLEATGFRSAQIQNEENFCETGIHVHWWTPVKPGFIMMAWKLREDWTMQGRLSGVSCYLA